ncbi:hypothetical protein ACFXA3_17735 [Streptomyces sp. NPDC059456]|uniref:hypothetical protein n=1 Tax=Streptomyces sp. NPDC059456 TaxID=3346838 RepID=UPI00369B4BA6
MLVTHTLDRSTLRVKVHRDLDITNRAAAALQIEALVAANRPERVILELPTAEPAPATLSAVARAQRMCRSLNVAFTVTGAHVRLQETLGQDPARRLDSGARRRR